MHTSINTNRIIYEDTWTFPCASFHCALVDRLKNTSLSVSVGPRRVCLHTYLLQAFWEKTPAAFLRGRGEEQSKKPKASSQLTECLSGHQLVARLMQSWLGFNCQSLKDPSVVAWKPQDRPLSLPLHAGVAEAEEGACLPFWILFTTFHKSLTEEM